MPSYKVKVKWGRENYPDVEANTDEEPILFKAQLYALTGVLPERQKVMCKGTQLKDNEWNIQIKDGTTFLLLGSKEEVPQEPVEKPKFIEDMDESELAVAMKYPAGLTNLGNTCYMSATVQCLYSVPELREALSEFNKDTSGSFISLGSPSSITAAMKNTFNQMESNNTVTPIILLQTLHLAFPQFAQPGQNGTYKQQDANECWSELLKILQQELSPKSGGLVKHKSFIEQYFGGTLDIEMKCNEAPDETPTRSKEDFLQLTCFISPEVKYMHTGLKSKMQEQLTKRSVTLGRDAIYTKSALISRLPAYLTVQFMRFEFKSKEAINAKILKDIKFPIDFDAYELCTPELKDKLTPMRSKFKEIEDAKVENQQKDKDLPKKEQHGNSEKEVKYEPYWFEDDIGSNNSGYYTLQAVLTHKGRSCSSGHYVAWVRQKGDHWMKFDDNVVTSVTTEEILRLSGGGDWHCAYVLLYGPKRLEIVDKSEASSSAVSINEN